MLGGWVGGDSGWRLGISLLLIDDVAISRFSNTSVKACL